MTSALEELQIHVPGQPERETQVCSRCSPLPLLMALTADQFAVPRGPLRDILEEDRRAERHRHSVPTAGHFPFV